MYLREYIDVIECAIEMTGYGLSGKFGQGAKLRAEVGVVQESVFLMPYVYECSVQAGHDLFDPAEIDVPYVKLIAWFLLMELYQPSILKQSHLYTLRGAIYNELFIQDQKNLMNESDEAAAGWNINKTQKRKE